MPWWMDTFTVEVAYIPSAGLVSMVASLVCLGLNAFWLIRCTGPQWASVMGIVVGGWGFLLSVVFIIHASLS